MISESVEVAIIGAGIAGASAAAHIAKAGKVLLIEREAQPGYHTTGRSAALFSKTYGPSPIRALSRASEAFFDAPPQRFAPVPLLSPRGCLFTVREDQGEAADALMADLSGHGVERISARHAKKLCPLLSLGSLAEAIWDDAARDIDVDALHQGFLRQARAAGASLLANAGAHAISRVGDSWEIETSAGKVRANIIVNAAGAWADEVAASAGARPAGLSPKRRTAMIVTGPEGVDLTAMRMVIDVEEQFYLKPEAGKLLISPADETPSLPCDAQPEELDVAICVDRIERAFELSIRRIERKWAGLRSFVADKVPVIGFAPDCPGFFWLAGQGGYGIQTAPAAGAVAAALISGQPMPGYIGDQGLDVAALAPGRASSIGG